MVKRAYNLYLEERLMDAVGRACKRLQCDAGLPGAPPKMSAVVTRALESWLEEHGEEVPGRDGDEG